MSRVRWGTDGRGRGRCVGVGVVEGWLDVRPAAVGGVVQYLALPVGQFNDVEVDEADGANPGQ